MEVLTFTTDSGESIISTADPVQQRNRDLASKINEEAKREPESQYAGKFIGIANGGVVAVTDDLEELVERLRQAEPDPSKTFSFQAGVDYSEVQEIWGMD